MPEPAKTAVLERAQQLFAEYYGQCFWHLKRDLQVTDDNLHIVVKGLRVHGDRRAFIEAAALEEKVR